MNNFPITLCLGSWSEDAPTCIRIGVMSIIQKRFGHHTLKNVHHIIGRLLGKRRGKFCNS